MVPLLSLPSDEFEAVHARRLVLQNSQNQKLCFSSERVSHVSLLHSIVTKQMIDLASCKSHTTQYPADRQQKFLEKNRP